MNDYLRQIETAAHSALRRTFEFVEIGPFCAYFDPLSDLVWLNYAAPIQPFDDGAAFRVAMGSLRAEFAERNRRLRFEFIQSLWPELPAMLLREGLVLQAEQPLMICSAHTFTPREVDGLRIHHLSSRDGDAILAMFQRTASEGFGAKRESTDESRRRLRVELESDARRAVIGFINDEPAGVAALSPMGDTAELVGVTTLPQFRRRGIASALSSHLLVDHFARGKSAAWLSAGDEAARAVYQRIGFADAGIYANYIAPESTTSA
jgi:ribosomal protein S18 acetylase RimI-like enzyme